MKDFVCHAKKFASCPIGQCFLSSGMRSPRVFWRCLRSTCFYQEFGGLGCFQLLLVIFNGLLYISCGKIVLLFKEMSKKHSFWP